MKQSWSASVFMNKAMLVIIILLVVSNVYLALTLSKKESITHLVPPGLNDKAWISQNNASEDYIKSFALYVASLEGNASPSNVDFIAKTLLPLVSPDIYNDFKQGILKKIEQMKLHQATSSYQANKVIFDKDESVAFVVGKKTEKTAYSDPKQGEYTYEVKVRIRNGMPIIEEFKGYYGKPDLKGLAEKKKLKNKE